MRYENYTGRMNSDDYIKAALLTLLETRPYSAVTIKDICQTAMVNRSTFYAHYKNLDDLYRTYMAEVASGLVHAVTDGGGDGILLRRGRAYRCYCAWFEHVRQNCDVFRIFLGDHGPPEFRRLLHRQGIAWYTRLFEACAQIGELDIPIDILTLYIVNAHFGLLQYYVESGLKYSPEFMAKKLVSLTFAGPGSLLHLFDH